MLGGDMIIQSNSCKKGLITSILGVGAIILSSSISAGELESNYSHMSVEVADKNAKWNRLIQAESGSFAPIRSNEADESTLSASEMISTVFSSLGVRVSDLEDVLKVKRATLYNWKNDGDVKSDENIKRLKLVYSIANEISEFSAKPFGRLAKTHLYHGKSYLERLSEDQLDTKLIIEHAKILSDIVVARRVAGKKTAHAMNDIVNISGELAPYE